METAARIPATGIETWFDPAEPALYGSRCTGCSAVAFPPVGDCPSPSCAGHEQARHRLASTGSVWSYTTSDYPPPAPYVVTTDPFVPVVVAAVALDADDLVVLGQCAPGVVVTDLEVGGPMRLVADVLFTDADGTEQLVWKWEPTDG